MAKKVAVTLSGAERARLRTLVGGGRAPARMLTHARILLKSDQGAGGPAWTDAAIAAALEVHPATVARVRQQGAAEGVEAALARKAPDREYQRKLDGAQQAHLIALACGAPPAGRARWTLRLLATGLVALGQVAAVSHETVRQTLKQTSSSRT